MVNFAILGCGRIGNRHADHAAKFGRLVGVGDNDGEKSRLLGAKHKAPHFSSLSNLLSGVKGKCDVIAICTPNGLHAEHAIACLKAGFNVLVEKPMATNTYDAMMMIQVAEENNRRLFVVKQNRFNPPVVLLKQLLSQNKLGNVTNVQLTCYWNRNEDYYQDSWKGTLDMDGGTLFTQFSHFLDLILWLFGDIDELDGWSANFMHSSSIDFEDAGVLALKFKSGTLGTINYSVNSFGSNLEGSLTVLGTCGSVKIGGQYLNELEYFNVDGQKKTQLEEGNRPNDYGKYVGSMSNHNLVYENLVEVLENNGSVSTSAIEGLRTVKLIEDIYSKIR